MPRCTGGCAAMWPPATSATDAPGGVSGLSVVKRPDGANQIAYRSKPLYTFSKDSADNPAAGDNAGDSFGGTAFTWHAVIVSVSDVPLPDPGGGGY
jgi:predicted lipoprotein with Yx(FWY)xxD motif